MRNFSLVKPLLLASTLVTAALLAPSAWAQKTACPPTATAPTSEQIQQGLARAQDRGALWKITKDGRSSYLFGSIHIGKFDWMFPGPKVREALAKTEVLAVEVNVMDPAAQAEMMAAQKQAAAVSVSAAEQARLDRQADAACVPRNAFASLHPVMQAVTYLALAGRSQGMDPSYGQEMMLIGAANATQRPIVQLESMASQMALFLPTEPSAARTMFEQMLIGIERPAVASQLSRMGEAWATGDLELIGNTEKLCACTLSAEERAFEIRLNDDRNPHLAQRIADEHAKGKPLFAAVGILHMTGGKPLPKLLEGLGFQVERVSYP